LASPRRQTAGRHRRPKNTGAPAYLTAATLAAFAVSGVNVPGAIGASSDSRVATSTTIKRSGSLAAQQLRDRLANEDAVRSSRERVARDAAVRTAKREARRQARLAALRARPDWVLPVSHFRLTAGFGESSYLWSTVHTGQDFAAPEGTPVHAIGAGRIIFAGWDGAYGYKIAIEHDDGTVTWYAHLSGFERTSGRVGVGEVIGLVGATGNVTGSHLHLEVRPGNGAPVDPLPWLREHGVTI
jgi:murein DD-endopeptidase MepM/ murein hydrolase activator NlpD